MQKILKFIGIISALILSALGLSACDNGDANVALYGVVEPPYEKEEISGEFDEEIEEIPLEDNINESFTSEILSEDE